MVLAHLMEFTGLFLELLVLLLVLCRGIETSEYAKRLQATHYDISRCWACRR